MVKEGFGMTTTIETLPEVLLPLLESILPPRSLRYVPRSPPVDPTRPQPPPLPPSPPILRQSFLSFDRSGRVHVVPSPRLLFYFFLSLGSVLKGEMTFTDSIRNVRRPQESCKGRRRRDDGFQTTRRSAAVPETGVVRRLRRLLPENANSH